MLQVLGSTLGCEQLFLQVPLLLQLVLQTQAGVSPLGPEQKSYTGQLNPCSLGKDACIIPQFKGSCGMPFLFLINFRNSRQSNRA